MCGRVVWVWDAKTGRLVQKIDERALDDPQRIHVLNKARYNVPPASHLPVIDGRGDEPQITIARWGFPIPQRPNGVFNTRIETAAESPMWRGMLGNSHCIFPVQGFYEWRQDGKRRTPHFVHRDDGELLLLAGLIQTRTWNGETKPFGSILTCPPDEIVGKLHDRMPVVIEAKSMQDWLSADTETAFEMAVPVEGVLTFHQVSDAVGNTKHDSPELMEPIAQTGLGAF